MITVSLFPRLEFDKSKIFSELAYFFCNLFLCTQHTCEADGFCFLRSDNKEINLPPANFGELEIHY